MKMERRGGKERKPEEPCGSDSRSCDNPALGLSPARHAPGRSSSHPQNVEQKLGNIQQRQSHIQINKQYVTCRVSVEEKMMVKVHIEKEFSVDKDILLIKFYWHLCRDGDSSTSLGSLFQCLITLSVKKNFLISSLNLPWCNLRPFPLVLSLVTWEKRPTPPLYNLLSVVESDKVSPQPPFLQAKQSQLPQPLFIRLLLQTLHQLRCPSLDTLQHLNVSLVVGGPKLNTGFEVRPHQCRVQGHDHCPTPAGHAIFDTSQDAIGFLGHLGTLPAHIQAAVNQHPQVLLCQAAFQPLFPKPVALHGVAVTQDLALGLAEPHTIDLGPWIQPVQVPLQSLPTLKQINTPTPLGVICKLTESALDPSVQIIDKDIKENWPQHRALGNTTCDWPPTGVNSIHHHSLGLAIQPVLYPEKSTPVQAMSSQFLQFSPHIPRYTKFILFSQQGSQSLVEDISYEEKIKGRALDLCRPAEGMPYSKGHVCLRVFPRDGRGWEGHSGQGSKENSSLMTDQMKAKKRGEGGLHAL
ncbi:LOW QUALITY PROTEIN: hypothetical protein QYF61_007425 [Mycteria americana]|uniref:Uncharacterized protein n=1 Tax=Mycteria americana TaxID=33587 RepID=A0AAN7N191_MYCAM|nr:LOW QUALITY PROTEIN: hypothetical protein QYF61_007425 [Mycteria americana]